LGVGGVAAGIMHLLAHGFFKALLFLGAGSVIHGCHHEQDIRKMGSLRRLMPVTFLTYAVGMMTLSGVPLFFSGGWTKEEILHATAHWPKSQVPYYLILAGVILTALYMTRQIIYVFFGKPRAASEHAHESPRVMTMPLIALAFCAIFFTVVLTPAWPWLHAYLTVDPALHFGTGSAALSAVPDNFWEASQRISTSAASVPESMKRRSAPGVSAAWCPGGTRDKSKLISAPSPSACSRCCFFTHGWLDHSAHHC